MSLARVWEAIGSLVGSRNADNVRDAGQKAAIEDHERRIRALERDIKKRVKTLEADE